MGKIGRMDLVQAYVYEAEIWEEGWKEGLEQGIVGTITILKSLGIDLPLIQQKIRTQYHLTEEEAVWYMNQGNA